MLLIKKLLGYVAVGLMVLQQTLTEGRPSHRVRHKHHDVTTRCQDPDLSRMKLRVQEQLRDTFYLLPSLRNGINFTDIPAKYRQINRYTTGGSRYCPKHLSFKKGGDLCPVYHVLNVDENRIPKSFLEADCSCKSPPESLLKKTTVECVKQYLYTRVLRRVNCLNGYYVYSEVWEPIRIGCLARRSAIRTRFTPSPTPPRIVSLQ